jgi:hypothetical protein
MIETVAIETWIYDTLSGDAELSALLPGGVYPRLAPEGQWDDHITVRRAGRGGDDNTLGLSRGVVEAFYEVRVWHRGDDHSVIAEAANRMDALLHGGAQEDTDPRFVMERTETIEDDETENGVTWYALGGVYRVLATPE